MFAETLCIHARFCGPPGSGNGGYSAGLLASALGGSDLTVTLRRPPPLDAPLRLERDANTASLWADDALIASALRAALVHDVPPPPAFAEAEAAERRFTGLDRHIFPGCFVCGPARAAGDGLRIFPGAGTEPGQVAATWTPDPSLAGEGGALRSEFVWAALDCPGYFAVEQQAGLALLGRLNVSIARLPRVGEPLIVTGWAIGSSGRKHEAGTAVHDRSGALVAAGAATWITLEE